MTTAADSGARRGACRWPAEWAPHTATWLAWPRNPRTWPGKFARIPAAYARFVEAVARFEPVRLLAAGDVREVADALVGRLPRVTLHDIPTNDSWIRDFGPIFLQPTASQSPTLLDWHYNAWGGKYPSELDDDVPRRVAQLLGATRIVGDLVLEGGAIEGNGRGTLLTTESCLLNPSRNPERTREEIERRLSAALGVSHFLWLSGEGIEGDDTDGHIDQLARFVAPATVVAASCDDPRDPNHHPLAENVRRLRSFQDESGRPLDVIELPIPRPRWCFGRRLPCSYCNFCLVNGGVIVPTFDDVPSDSRALATLRDLFPGREVVGVDAVDLIWGLGAFHCLSQQQPE